MFRICLLSIFLCLIYACQKKSAPQPIDTSQLETFLTEYSRQQLRSNDPIILVFKEEVNMDKASQALSIQPTKKGNVRVEGLNTIMFQPEEPWEYGQNYLLKASLNDLLKNGGNGTVLEFGFSILPLEFSLQVDPVVGYDESTATINGTLHSSDKIKAEVAERMISIGNAKGDFSWVHSNDEKTHHFTITNIPRQSSEEEVTLKWDGTKYDKSFIGSQLYKIAHRGAFKLIDINPQNNGRMISLQFSNPLDPQQRLEGLIELKDNNSKIQYEVKGSMVSVYLDNPDSRPLSLLIDKNIKSLTGKTLDQPYSKNITFDPIKPELRLLGSGVVTPFDASVIFPFEAKGLQSVDVEILKIFNDNVLQYLQNNRLDEVSYYLEPVGRIVHQEKLNLSDLNSNPDYGKWTRYALDLQNFINIDRGALYLVRIGFRRSYTNYPCSEESIEEEELVIKEPPVSILRWNSDYEGYRYSHRNNPCFPVYYNENNFIQKNVLASNLGLMVKGDASSLDYYVSLNDLRDLQPIENVQVNFYDFQQQLIMSSTINGEGRMELPRKPSFVIASKSGEYAYLNIRDERSNSLSNFDISGKKSKAGIDAYIYGERGVWRPGDSLFLTLVIEDELNALPKGHPFSFEIYNARSQSIYQRSDVISDGNIYTHKVSTNEQDVTGNWRAIATIGDHTFSKILKVETVKPNRIKMEYQLPESINVENGHSLNLNASWLYGAPASSLAAKVDMSVKAESVSFNNYLDFRFTDPAQLFSSFSDRVYDGKLNAEGSAKFDILTKKSNNLPGKIIVNLKTRVYEASGEYSEDNVSTSALPYSSYVGINIPKSQWGRKMISTEKNQSITLVVLDQKGKPIANRSVSIGLYEAEWSWWYNRSRSNIYQFNQSNHLNAEEKVTLITNDKGEITWRPSELNKYRYLVRACDDESGHCSGELFFTPYYDYDTNDGGASILRLQADKSTLNVGEKTTITVPTNKNSRILVSLEAQNKVIDHFWVDGKEGATSFDIHADNRMVPNIYCHVTLIQAYNNGTSDLPLRMYGVLPLKVIDPSTILEPVVISPEDVEPQKKFTVQVSERQGKDFYYTLAVVDEGLLGLTRYKTPDLWNSFNAKQALEVKTWDLYDMVLHGYGGEISKHISIGGDGEVVLGSQGKNTSRFKPIVRFEGPFYLEKGENQSHSFTIDNYIGQVRAMVIARNKNAYGNTEKSIYVKSPLMVLPTAPRVLSPLETFNFPVNTIATDDKIKTSNLTIKLGPGLTSIGPKNMVVDLTESRDVLSIFQLQAENYQGPTYIEVKGFAGKNSNQQRIDFIINNPNPFTTKEIETTINVSENKTITYAPIGVEGTQSAYLEMSTFPSLNLENRLSYLIRYPYGCVEQTTSAVFPQLYLSSLMKIEKEEKEKIHTNIRSAIKRLGKFQTSSGGFAYWPGNRDASEWGSSYAGHFLIEAQKSGYYIPHHLISAWKKYQIAETRAWQNPDNNAQRNNMQAYRLYTLVKAGETPWAAMNKLRANNINSSARYMLASAYAMVGKESVARELIGAVPLEVNDYQELSYTYGSSLRDEAMMIEAIVENNFNQNADLSAQVIALAKEIGKDQWLSTQTTAFALLAIGKYLKNNPVAPLAMDYKINGKLHYLSSDKPIFKREIPLDGQSVELINKSAGTLYASIILKGKADYETSTSKRENLDMAVRYYTLDGKPVSLANLSQGLDFIAEVTVENPRARNLNLEEMALRFPIPSGCEIQNSRISGTNNTVRSDAFDYQDIRDDRVNTFFDLRDKKTFRFLLTATYAGKYYQPDIICEAMYDGNIQHVKPGTWINIFPVKNNIQ